MKKNKYSILYKIPSEILSNLRLFGLNLWVSEIKFEIIRHNTFLSSSYSKKIRKCDIWLARVTTTRVKYVIVNVYLIL